MSGLGKEKGWGPPTVVRTETTPRPDEPHHSKLIAAVRKRLDGRTSLLVSGVSYFPWSAIVGELREAVEAVEAEAKEKQVDVQ